MRTHKVFAQKRNNFFYLDSQPPYPNYYPVTILEQQQRTKNNKKQNRIEKKAIELNSKYKCTLWLCQREISFQSGMNVDIHNITNSKSQAVSHHKWQHHNVHPCTKQQQGEMLASAYPHVKLSLPFWQILTACPKWLYHKCVIKSSTTNKSKNKSKHPTNPEGHLSVLTIVSYWMNE